MFCEVGSFGKVKLVKKKNTNKYSCVKIMKKEELIKSQQVDHISNEYRILSTISHPFVVNVEWCRWTSKDLLKTHDISICIWSMFLVENSSPTSGKRGCLNLIKQRLDFIIQLLLRAYRHYLRISSY